MESFLNYEGNGIRNYFEHQLQKILYKREDYKKISIEISKIKKQYPNVQDYLENENIISLSDEEKNAILKIFHLQDDLRILEELELFKLGFKEAYIFFEVQDMLNI